MHHEHWQGPSFPGRVFASKDSIPPQAAAKHLCSICSGARQPMAACSPCGCSPPLHSLFPCNFRIPPLVAPCRARTKKPRFSRSGGRMINLVTPDFRHGLQCNQAVSVPVNTAKAISVSAGTCRPRSLPAARSFWSRPQEEWLFNVAGEADSGSLLLGVEEIVISACGVGLGVDGVMHVVAGSAGHVAAVEGIPDRF